MATLSIRIPDALALALAARKENSATNISAFCRRAIERELARPILDAEPAPATPALRDRNVTRPPVVFVQTKETR